VVHEAQRFFDMLAEDVHIATEGGEWLGFDFDNESLNFTAEFVGPVSHEQIQAFYAAFDGTTSLRRATIAQFTQITEAIGEDELIGFGLYQSDHEPEPAEWRCLSRRDALRIADEMQLLAGVAGEARPETHLPAVIDSSAGAKLFKDRTPRAGALPDRMPDLVREIESSLSKRITRIEENMDSNTQAIRDLRESSAATEESFKGLLNAVENFCGQATRQLERLLPQTAEIPKAIAAPMDAAPVEAAPVVQEFSPVAEGAPPEKPMVAPVDKPAAISPEKPAVTLSEKPAGAAAEKTPSIVPEKTPAPTPLPEVTPIFPEKPRRSWRGILAAAAAIIILATAGLVWWPRSADSAGQAPVGGTPSSVIASSEPAASPQPKLDTTASPAPDSQKPSPIVPAGRVIARPQPSASSSELNKAAEVPRVSSAADAAAAAMQVEIEADEPAWVMITDKDGRILIARTLQANETRTLDIGDNATLRTGNAGGLHVRLNGKDLGHLGPAGKIRDIQFKSGEFKVTTPDAG
jgi:hypothetical protein